MSQSRKRSSSRVASKTPRRKQSRREDVPECQTTNVDDVPECQTTFHAYTLKKYRIECPFACGFEACADCHIKHLVTTTQVPHCMNCRREWSLEFMETTFKPRHLLKLKKHHRKILLARDDSFLPEAQIALKNLKRKRIIYEKLAEIRKLKYQLEREYRAELARQEDLNTESEKQKKLQAAQLLTKCPLEDCRGFINGQICELCTKKICRQCMKEKLNDHKCCIDDVANVKYLKKHSKPCPKCGYRTSKVSGCPQMFCVSCHTAWNWTTGREERGVIHNPHFFEWQRQHKGRVERNPMDIVCGGLPNHIGWNYDRSVQSRYNPVLRIIHHIRENRVNVPQYQYRPRQSQGPPVEKDHEDVRIRYLDGEITQEQRGRILLARQKAYKKHEAYFNLHQMFVLAATDILQRCLSLVNSKEDDTNVYQELEKLRSYYNQQLIKTQKRYKDKTGRFMELISNDWSPVKWNLGASIVFQDASPEDLKWLHTQFNVTCPEKNLSTGKTNCMVK